ncbi:MAG: NAD(P)-binding domain-containing protein [Myxococcaceae bacterium]|nr:NAD(P)-binding domain-containing protein [Myxococcaceae bacterium]MCI0671609.1 NAD(P)-binding domain-containing protein [Myxococcaceae bacterium]
MDIGIIGAGLVGGTCARLLVRAGHRVMVANSRGPQTLAGLIDEMGFDAVDNDGLADGGRRQQPGA